MAQYTTKLIMTAINAFQLSKVNGSKSIHPQLTLRFAKLARDQFSTSYVSMLKNGVPKISCIAEVTSNNIFEQSTKTAEYIQRLEYGDDNPLVTWCKRDRLVPAINISAYLPHVLITSVESVIEPFEIPFESCMKFSLCADFPINYSSNAVSKSWIMRFSAIKIGSLSELSTSIKNIKLSLFGIVGGSNGNRGSSNVAPTPVSADTFLKHAISLDCEYIIELIYSDDLPPSEGDLGVVNTIFTSLNNNFETDNKQQAALANVGKLLNIKPNGKWKIRQLVNKVISLSKNSYYSLVWPPVNWLATLKLDGYRCVIHIAGGRVHIISDLNIIEFELVLPRVIVMDGEWTTSKDSTLPVINVFDTLYEGKSVESQPINDRIAYISAIVDAINKTEKVRAVVKRYVTIHQNTMKEDFESLYDGCENDGIILVEPGKSYRSGKCYKWKPYEHNTIDFYAIKCPQKLLGVKPYINAPGCTLYLLFVGINKHLQNKIGMGFMREYRTIFPTIPHDYFPIQFSPSMDLTAYLFQYDGNESIDHKIVELGKTRADNESNESNRGSNESTLITSPRDGSSWRLVKIRTDRPAGNGYYGNDFFVAESTYVNFIDPFEFEDLYTRSAQYFTKNADTMYESANKFKRYVISIAFKEYLFGAKWIIDEASGRGADLHRYYQIGAQNVLFIEIDRTALAELIRRKYEFGQTIRGGNNEYGTLIDRHSKHTVIHTMLADMKTPASQLQAETYQYGATPGVIDGIVCNFALHYMCDTIDNMRNVLLFNAKMLRVGGIFIFTVMDGAKIHDILRGIKQGESHIVMENDRVKYAIRRDYVSNSLAKCGQMISVKLPLADEMYEEPLCNVKAVIVEAGKLGFELVSNVSMADHAEQFKQANPRMHAALTADDLWYVSLHHTIVLKKVSQKKLLAWEVEEEMDEKL